MNINEAAWIQSSWMLNIKFQIAIFRKPFKIIWCGFQQSPPNWSALKYIVELKPSYLPFKCMMYNCINPYLVTNGKKKNCLLFFFNELNRYESHRDILVYQYILEILHVWFVSESWMFPESLLRNSVCDNLGEFFLFLHRHMLWLEVPHCAYVLKN